MTIFRICPMAAMAADSEAVEEAAWTAEAAEVSEAAEWAAVEEWAVEEAWAAAVVSHGKPYALQLQLLQFLGYFHSRVLYSTPNKPHMTNLLPILIAD